jgi:transposase
LRRYLRRRGIRAVIPSKSNQAPPARLRPGRLPERNRVECTINRLKQWRQVATRYEKREANYLAMVTITAIVLQWLE